jgi:putative redox protein
VSDVAVEVRWEEALRFEAEGRSGVGTPVDGEGRTGPTPMESLLIALASCMGSDVVDILTKMRVPIEELSVRAEGDRRPEPPRRYTAIRLTYETKGVPEDAREKLQRAVDLSQDKYCSVLHTLQPDVDLSIRIDPG